ncbi:FAD-dependent 5-carboxymethylaminomethyl-2-thiouridine(34) oxidoreductase MnmC [Herbaspirillum rubrisubalbicans]|uniref:FAD-dependent 5-carboxymethylaminomethyl-2-thiouridine(34) oxidoreductase MnmC n=1 Tax=Herbaspirillum rubrisubalbicans TaxID=80842 RepID=UPI001558898E|nr:FAD-dependent 5-carboxymethylaminomethyl-2-thiouridine(34) oxidoreductase MnmC [Herbaspirillum rubrisubalbicans]NQE50765.1 bifunctional tRNA (mnm(5)s(2)U34)-methyltransferase/FAD-dependent cmnm(5)s(2)U34 oxidoreductase [Herbaspirillum rubrisubalbicans]
MPARPLQLAGPELLAAWHAEADRLMPALDAVPDCLRQQHSATVLDLHFGLGHSFFATWHAFARQREQGQGGAQRLHYVAILPHPPAPQALHQDLTYAQALRAAWPLPLPGTHRLLLDEGRLTLTLIWGALEEELARLDAPIDLFYLHAEAERFDPDAPGWHAHACKRLARLAWTGAQALVFGAAGQAPLAAAMRQVGFTGQERDGALALRYAPAWARPATHVATLDTPLQRDAQHPRHALVIGAGLAGTAAAERLSARGWRIELIDAGPQVATRASGNHGGLFMPALARDDSPLARLTRAAFLFAAQRWQALGGVGLEEAAAIQGECCGILQFGRDAKQAWSFEQGARQWQYPERYARWMSAEETAAALGMATMGGGYFFPEAGWLHPPSVCRRMLAVAREQGAVATHFGREVSRLQREAGQWQARDAAGEVIAQAPVVIFAAGAQASALAQLAELPLNAVRGQVTHLPAAGFPDLPYALCGDGYLTRPYAGQLALGASYDRFDDPSLRADSHADNLARLQHMLPQIASHYTLPEATASQPGRVGQRCIAPDRLPLVGALPEQEGLYSLLGYASRGLIWAPLMAELLAAMLEREPLPLPRDLVAALDPARFKGAPATELSAPSDLE